MSKNKTAPKSDSVADFVASIEHDQRRADSARLLELMSSGTGVEPVLWGSSIIGFGTNHYKYDNGREGDTVAVGFSPRSQALVLYGLGYDDQDPGTAKALGKLTTGKGCVYIKRMDDINTDVLAGMVKKAFIARHNGGS